jgi:transposase
MKNTTLQDIIYTFYRNNNFTVREISVMFKINISTVGRWIKYVKKPRKLKYDNASLLKTIKETLVTDPFITLKNIQSIVVNKYNYKTISLSLISKYVNSLNYTYKKVSTKIHGSDRIKLNILQEQFRKSLKKVSNNNCICIDESGFMSNDSHKYGRSIKGTRIYNYIKSNPKNILF